MNYQDMGGREKQPGYRDIPDEAFQAFMDAHPNGSTVQEIATFMGLTRERVTQIINRSLVKLQRVCERRDISAHDFPVKETTWDRMTG